jgi:hypothetical protein
MRRSFNDNEKQKKWEQNQSKQTWKYYKGGFLVEPLQGRISLSKRRKAPREKSMLNTPRDKSILMLSNKQNSFNESLPGLSLLSPFKRVDILPA